MTTSGTPPPDPGPARRRRCRPVVQQGDGPSRHHPTRELTGSASRPASASWSGCAPRRSTAAPTASTPTASSRVRRRSAQRVNAVAVWNESPFFTERERAALRFTEVVTRVAETHVPAEEYDAVAAHWSPDKVGALLALIVTINAWNGLAVASRAWDPVLADETTSGKAPRWSSTSPWGDRATLPRGSPGSTRRCARPSSTDGSPPVTACRRAATSPVSSGWPAARSPRRTTAYRRGLPREPSRVRHLRGGRVPRGAAGIGRRRARPGAVHRFRSGTTSRGRRPANRRLHDLSIGLPDPALFPLEVWRRLVSAQLRRSRLRRRHTAGVGRSGSRARCPFPRAVAVGPRLRRGRRRHRRSPAGDRPGGPRAGRAPGRGRHGDRVRRGGSRDGSRTGGAPRRTRDPRRRPRSGARPAPGPRGRSPAGLRR